MRDGARLAFVVLMLVGGALVGPAVRADNERPERDQRWSAPRWEDDGRRDGDNRRDRYDRRERVQLVGVVLREFRNDRLVEVRTRQGDFRVDVSDAEVIGARRDRIRAGARVRVWGLRRGSQTVDAVRVQILGYDRDDRDRWDGDYDYDRRGIRISGRVTDESSPTGSRDISVVSDGVQWRIEVPRGIPITRARRSISVHDIDRGDYVRILGERTGERSLRARQIEVLADRDDERWGGRDDRWGNRDDRDYRDGAAYVGSVRDVDEEAGTFHLRVNLFETYRVRAARGTRLVHNGRTVSFRDLHRASRVRVWGDLDARSRTIDARSVEIL